MRTVTIENLNLLYYTAVQYYTQLAMFKCDEIDDRAELDSSLAPCHDTIFSIVR